MKILDHALKHFANYGYRGARTREIAESAAVNHALIKYYFQNKEMLWKQAVDHMFAHLVAAMALVDNTNAHEPDPVQRFRNFIQGYVRYCALHPEHGRILMQESSTDNERLKWIVDNHLKQTLQPLEETVVELIKLGAIPSMPVESFRYLFVGACQNLFVLGSEAKLLYGIESTDAEVIEKHASAVADLFIR